MTEDLYDGTATDVRRQEGRHYVDVARQVVIQPAPAADRLGAAWRGKWWIVSVTVAVVVLTFVVSSVVPKTYESAADVSVSASPTTNGQSSDLVTAGNDLASQYAQFAKSAPVLQRAARDLKISESTLSDAISTGTLAGQNVIEIKVQADSATAAQSQATAVANGLVDYIRTSTRSQSAAYLARVNTSLASLTQEISTARKNVSEASDALNTASRSKSSAAVSAATARYQAAQTSLSSLLDRQQQVLSAAALQGAALNPSVSRLGATSNANVSQPRPSLYTIVGGLLALMLATMVVVTLDDRKKRLGTAEVAR